MSQVAPPLEEILDRPIWTALTTRHERFSLGGDRAKRFDPEVSPFACVVDREPASIAALAELAGTGEELMLLQREEIDVPQGFEVELRGIGVQMIVAGESAEPSPDPTGVVVLGADDAAEMVALAELTRPGPFRVRTHELGRFIGIRDQDGRLVAMAGERLKHPGWTEVSGVCTHPNARGKGYGRTLSTLVMNEIFRRGERPYLHAYSGNAVAIRLYEDLGFEIRCEVDVAILRRT